MNSLKGHEAYFSQMAADLYGSSFYKTVDGDEVEITAVISHGFEYNWPDKRFVDYVTDFVRHGQIGSEEWGEYEVEDYEKYLDSLDSLEENW